MYLFIYQAVLGLSRSTPASLQTRHTGSVAVWQMTFPMACGILAPRPGIEPMSPVLTDGLLTTEPPGKPRMSITP